MARCEALPLSSDRCVWPKCCRAGVRFLRRPAAELRAQWGLSYASPADRRRLSSRILITVPMLSPHGIGSMRAASFAVGAAIAAWRARLCDLRQGLWSACLFPPLAGVAWRHVHAGCAC